LRTVGPRFWRDRMVESNDADSSFSKESPASQGVKSRLSKLPRESNAGRVRGTGAQIAVPVHRPTKRPTHLLFPLPIHPAVERPDAPVPQTDMEIKTAATRPRPAHQSE